MRSRDLLLSGADYDWITNYYTKWITGHEISRTDTRFTMYKTSWTTEWTEMVEDTGGGGGSTGDGGGSSSVTIPWVGMGDLNNGIASWGEGQTNWIKYGENYLRQYKGGNGTVTYAELFNNDLMGFRTALIRNITIRYNTSDSILLADWRQWVNSVNDVKMYGAMVNANINVPGLADAYRSNNVAFLKQYAIDHPYFFYPYRKLNQAEFNAGQYWNLFSTYTNYILTMKNGVSSSSSGSGGGNSKPVKRSRTTSRETVRETIFKYYYWTYYQTSQSTSRVTKWYTDRYSDTRTTGVDPNQRYNGHLLSQTYYDRNDEATKEYGYVGESDHEKAPVISTGAYSPKIGSIPNRQALDPNSNKWMESREDRQANQSNSKNLYSNNKNELLQTPSNKRNLQTYYVHNEPVS